MVMLRKDCDHCIDLKEFMQEREGRADLRCGLLYSSVPQLAVRSSLPQTGLEIRASLYLVCR
jgi:hypothetical protein